MAQTPDTSPAQNAPAENDFDKRHAKELGAARFAKIQAAYTVVPMASAAAGAAFGHFVAAKPLAKMFPEANKISGATEAFTGSVWSAIDDLRNGKPVHEAFANLNLKDDQLNEIGKIWKDESLSKKMKGVRIAEAMKLELPEVSKSFRTGSSAGFGAAGLIVGSIAVGYDRWRKEESARIAAQEVNGDISKLELFRPSDAELVAENKRLRQMVAELPTPVVDPATLASQGRVQAKQMGQTVG